MFKKDFNLAMAACLFAMVICACGCGPTGYLIKPVSLDERLQEQEIMRDAGFAVRDKIAVIEVDGLMVNWNQRGLFTSGENPVSLFNEKLDKARSDDSVKAVVLRINSPGGTVSASDAMYHSLLEFKRQTGRPVIASILDVGASGGYYLACGCDGIIAQPTSITGSIGTIFQTFSFAGTMDKLGIKAEAVKSGEFKDMASPLKELKDDERQVINGIIMNFYDQFVDVVDTGRQKMNRQQVLSSADGKIYTAWQALELGLLDHLGYPQDAIQWAKQIANVERARVVMYGRPMSYKPNVYATASAKAGAGPLINIELPDWLSGQPASFLYLWQPGQ